MMTELPRGWQPIVNSSGRLARVAKVALDSKGTAYFMSELGEACQRQVVGTVELGKTRWPFIISYIYIYRYYFWYIVPARCPE